MKNAPKRIKFRGATYEKTASDAKALKATIKSIKKNLAEAEDFVSHFDGGVDPEFVDELSDVFSEYNAALESAAGKLMHKSLQSALRGNLKHFDFSE